MSVLLNLNTKPTNQIIKLASSSKGHDESDSDSNEPTPVVAVVATAAPSINSGGSDLIDHNKMACLLCKRRFDSIELLNKHVAKSDLHKVFGIILQINVAVSNLTIFFLRKTWKNINKKVK